MNDHDQAGQIDSSELWRDSAWRVAKVPTFLTRLNIILMGKVMSTEGSLGNIGVGHLTAYEGNSITVYCYCIIVNETGKFSQSDQSLS